MRFGRQFEQRPEGLVWVGPGFFGGLRLGNKGWSQSNISFFQVHIKHAGTSCELQLSPDSSILNLKEKIHSRFNILPEHQFLICNGKLLQASDTATIKQARIPNGSKILCSSKQRRREEEENTSSSSDNLVMTKLEKIQTDTESLEAKLIRLVNQKRALLEHDVPLFQGDRSEEIKKLIFESKKLGEALMQLFDSLDRLECSDQTQRSLRKQTASKINSVLDKNDRLGSKLSTCDS